MGIQEYAVAGIGIVAFALTVRKIYRIAKGKENACDCCSNKTGCCGCKHKKQQ